MTRGGNLTNASSIWGRSTGKARRVGRLVSQFCSSYAKPAAGGQAGSSAPPVNGDQIRDTWFWPPRYSVEGYDARQVQDLFRRIAAELDAGRPVGPLIESATLRTRELGGQYDIDAVDWFLGQFLLPPGRFGPDGISADPWRDLPVTQGHGKVAFMQPEAALACAVGRGGGDGWPLLCCPGRPGARG